ncbi:MAG: mechanosensitive ion channel [Chromatiales bacterium]|jgi:small conductance mechanosensitive channel|nr:mechanosensitive ion channel [Chromatiales bacterium]MDH4013387.1 mechanosensitive ion channel [Chromatiales bacterium]
MDDSQLETTARNWFGEFQRFAADFGLVDLGIRLIAAIAIFVIGKWVARKLADSVKRLMERGDSDEMLVRFVRNMVYFLLLTFVIMAAISQVGIETTSFIAVLGAAGFAVGLALQGSLANFAAGVLLLIFRPFKVGDFIEGAGVSGVVEALHVFTTTLKTGDNKTVIIPNGDLASGTIVNYSTQATRRVDLVFGIGYGDDIDKAKALMHEEMGADDRILKDPAPTVGLVELADSSVNFVCRPWVNSSDYWGVLFDLNERIKKRFDAEGINIPYPQQDVHIVDYRKGGQQDG